MKPLSPARSRVHQLVKQSAALAVVTLIIANYPLAQTQKRQPGAGTTSKQTSAIQEKAQRKETRLSPQVNRTTEAVRLFSFYDRSLALRYAPIVFHERSEPNKPTNVDWFLPRTSLWYYDRASGRNMCIVTGSRENPDPAHPWNPTPPCGNNYELTQTNIRWEYVCDGSYADSENSYDKNKEKTYYFRSVHPSYRSGNSDMSQWATYVRMYRSKDDITGRPTVTILYWRFYSFQSYSVLGVSGNHGGDWEGVQVVLDEGNTPIVVRYTTHQGLKFNRRPSAWDPNGSWGDLKFENGHPRIASEAGGHAGSPFTGNEANYIRQNTWMAAHGGLMHMGSYRDSLQQFVAYSGLWGTPKAIASDGPGGFWGPAFNGADDNNGFADGWCKGIDPPDDYECKAQK